MNSSSSSHPYGRHHELHQAPDAYGHIAIAIYELGLKISSPKVLLEIMPQLHELTTEHLKSHLQKYRIHRDRSLGDFMVYYDAYIKDKIECWKDWEVRSEQAEADEQNNGENCKKRSREVEAKTLAAKRKRIEDQVVNECRIVVKDMSNELADNVKKLLAEVEEQELFSFNSDDEIDVKDEDRDHDSSQKTDNNNSGGTGTSDAHCHAQYEKQEHRSTAFDILPLEVESDLDVS